MAYLEAAKQENFSPETLTVWYNEVLRLSWTEQEFRRAVMSALRNPTFGKVKFDDFLKNEEVFSADEVVAILEQKIRIRREELEKLIAGLSTPEQERRLAEEGLMSVREYWAGELRRQLERHVERIEKKCKRLRAQFYHLPEQSKIDLWAKAIQKGLAKDGDQFMPLILPQLVPMMIDEFEEAVKNASGLEHTESECPKCKEEK